MEAQRNMEECILSMLNYDVFFNSEEQYMNRPKRLSDVMASPDLSIPSSSSSSDGETISGGCSLCGRKTEVPRVLSCLHVYGEDCLKRYHVKEGFPPDGIKCPACEQETKLGSKGIVGLPLDYITSNMIDMEAIENMQIVCTSCKAKEKAVARCTECATFLCNNCVTAHQYMRCFENHKVVSFEDMKGAGDGFSIHKPVTCLAHPEETMKFYCHTCHIPICNECLVSDHKHPEHYYEKASDAEPKQKEELRNLVAESRSKAKLCEDATSSLNNCLSELQLQRDNAKSHIEETFQSYKAILEKQQKELLKELDGIHSEQELQVMDTSYSIDKTIEKIGDACEFAERLLAHGNTLELLSLKHIVGSQLLSLINNTPKLEITARFNFETDEEKFKVSIKETFGQVVKPDVPPKSDSSPLSQKVSPLHSVSSFENEEFIMPVDGAASNAEHALSPLDVDLTNNYVVQYNLAQLAGMVEDSTSQAASNHSTSPLTLEEILNPQLCLNETSSAGVPLGAIKSLRALAKLGALAMNNDEGMMNGPMSGLNLNSVQSPIHSPSTTSEALRGINTPSPIESLDSLGLLNGNSLTSPRVGSPFDGVLMNGSSMMGRMQNPSIMPPSALSPMQGSRFNPTPRNSAVKLNTMQIRCKFGQLGPGKCQFSSPHGFCLGIDEEIIVADTNNHRIQIFDKTGEFKNQFGSAGKEEGQLWYPRKVAVIRSSGKFVICDRGSERSRMQIFLKTGHFVKKIAIRYIDIVAGLAITSEGNIVAVDSVAPTVFIISEAGDLLQWFDCSEHMREPSDIAVNGKEFFVCDFKGHCVIVFTETGQFLQKIGNENITNFPNGIDISDAGDILVGDSHGNRFHIVVFSRHGFVLSEFECPYVKVSRCCGLKITSEGYVVTLAKNNHHVLVLNTLYIV